MNKVEEMKTFVQVVESGGISKAAAILGLAKSAISRRISDLEARLSVQLFNRSTRSLSLTDIGREFYQHCQRLLNDIDEVESNITSHHQKISGKIRLSAPLSFSIEHLAPAIKQFSERYPDVSFDLDLNDRRVNLIEENFDCAIRIGVLKDSQLVARKLFALKLSLLASQSYLDKHGIPSEISDLNQHIMIDYLLHQRENLTGVSIDGRLEKAQPKVAHARERHDLRRPHAAFVVVGGLGGGRRSGG